MALMGFVECPRRGMHRDDGIRRGMANHEDRTLFGLCQATAETQGRSEVYNEGPRTHGDERGGDSDRLDTIAFGTRASASSISLHDKTGMLRREEQLSPEDSIYAPTWRQSNAFTPGAQITRVELRFSARGLRFRSAEAETSMVYDFMVPHLLLDRQMVAMLWAAETARRRLTISDVGRRRCRDTDPRWLVVQQAAAVAAPILRRADVRELDLKHRRIDADRRTLRAIQSVASLQNYHAVDSVGLARIASAAIERALDRDGAAAIEYALVARTRNEQRPGNARGFASRLR